METDNISSDDHCSNTSENTITNGSTLHMDIAEENVIHAEAFTMDEEIPFFLGADNPSHVAEEVEVETSSVGGGGGCENIMKNGNEVIKYACELITLTYSPEPSSSEAAGRQSMQIILHSGKQSASEMAIASISNSGDNDMHGPNSLLLSESEPATQKPLLSEEKQEECENKETCNEAVASSPIDATTNNNLKNVEEPICTNTNEPAPEETTAETDICNHNDIVVEFEADGGSQKEAHTSPHKEGLASDDITPVESTQLQLQERKDSNDEEEADIPVRVSCIQWASKMDIKCVEVESSKADAHDASPAEHRSEPEPTSSSSVVCGNSLQNCEREGSSFFLCNPSNGADDNADKEQQDYDNLDFSEIWVPEITTTTIEDEEVQIIEAPQQCQVPMKRSLRYCCFHPCCLVMKDTWSCFPWWINYAQIQACIGSVSSIRPAGFQPPPESEWIVVGIHQTDPEDGALRYKCRNCEGLVEYRSTKQKYELNFNKLKYECKQCSRKYITKRQLKLHSLRHNEKKQVCPYCEKRFLTRNEIQNHLNTHTRQKPFQCPVCSQRFAHSSRYYNHIRNIHKKYDCNNCYARVCSSPGKSFSSFKYSKS